MRRWILCALALAAAAWLWPVGRPPSGALASPVSAALARSPAWDDGRAEFSVYDGVGGFEGKDREFVAKIIVVKEDFVRDLLVKSDPGPLPGKTFEVLKLNYLHDVPTGVYAFHQMASVFFDRETFEPVKFAMSSMESCGLTYVVAKPAGGVLHYASHSYWDREGDRETTLEWKEGAVFYDSLPLWLRGLDLTKPARFSIPLFPPQISSRIGRPALSRAEIEVLGPDPGHGGRLRVRVRHARGEDRLWFASEPPHVLWRWEKGNGTTLTLRKTMRLAYWERTEPEDEALLR